MPSSQTREDLDYLLFQRRVKEKIGIDLAAYKRPQMERRLRSLINQSGAASFQQYLHLLEKKPELMEALRQRMTINVSELFRNPDKFEELQQVILPELRSQERRLHAWSAGCSYGAESYSLAIILLESGVVGAPPILATDIDEEMLGRAREGIFTEADMKNVSPGRRQRFFARTTSGWRASECLRDMIQVKHHDLIADRFERGFHLILCRNVVIYFTDDAKLLLYRKFWSSLQPGGVLFIGGTEHINDAREIGFEPISAFFYRKAAPRGAERTDGYDPRSR
jgi:chemotaxis protein methyltransferase CheR